MRLRLRLRKDKGVRIKGALQATHDPNEHPGRNHDSSLSRSDRK